MKVQIKELGAIKEATIDLSKKLTVFCGPNGTGKTYMAYVLYALTNNENKSGIRVLANEKDIINQLILKNTTEIKLGNLEGVLGFRKRAVEWIKQHLWNVFAVPEEKATDFFAKTDINILEGKEEFEAKIYAMAINETVKIYDYAFIFEKVANTDTLKISVKDTFINNKDFQYFMETAFIARLYAILAFYPITSAIIFPVERNSIYTFSNELSIRKNDTLEQIQALVSQKNNDLFDLVFKRTTRYPQAIRDGLAIAEDLNNIQQRISNDYFEYATEIENELLKGKLSITKEGNVAFVSEKAVKVNLSFHQSSSIVKTLASLIIYLKYRAVKNDLVIIDEPELNLHPDNQIRLTRIIARLINNGLRFVISTHSDYIIRELNNLIMIASEDKDIQSIAKEQGYKEEEYLKKEEVGAYMFNYKNDKAKQVEVKVIKIDRFGFDVSTLDQTIEDLNKRSDELYYTLKYGKSTN